MAARAQLRARDDALSGPVLVAVLLYAALIFWPVAAYCYLAHPAWSWMYLVNPTSVPVLTVVLVLAVDLGAILGSFYLGARLLRAQKERYLYGGLAGAGALTLLMPIILGGRLFTYGTYQQFHEGRAVALSSVKLGYVLIAVVAGMVSALLFVAWSLFTWGRRVASA